MTSGTLTSYERLVFELGARESRGVQLLAFTPDFAQFSLADGSAVVVLRYDPDQPELLADRAASVARSVQQGTVRIVAVGGQSGQSLAQLPSERRPWMFGRQIHFIAVGDDGQIGATRRSSTGKDLKAAVQSLAASGSTVDSMQFRRWLEVRQQQAAILLERMQEHQARLVGRRPWVTWALVASFVLVFGLESLWGGANSIATVVRMGALVGNDALSDEWARLLACSFLHGGLLHLGGNALIVVMIGTFLERILGPSRFLALWVLSVLGGSVAALLLTDSVMVGASAGGWGLMTAAGVLALRPAGLLPDAIAVSLRGSVGRVLVLNLGISLLPGIALSAHVGGGLAGALVLASGLGRLGLGSPTTTPSYGQRTLAHHVALALGAVAGCLLWGALALAIGQGKPWLLGSEITWQSADLPNTKQTLELPELLGSPHRVDLAGGAHELTYGTALTSPWVVTVRVEPIVPLALSHLKVFRRFRAIKRRLEEETLPPGMARTTAATATEDDDSFSLNEAFSMTSGERRWRRARVTADAAVVVTVDCYGPDEDNDVVANRLLGSLADEKPTPRAEPETQPR